MLIVSSVGVTKLSFLLFFLSACLVFDQALAGFVVFHFHSHKRNVDLTIDHNTNVAQKLFENSVLKLSRCYLIQALIGQVS